MLKRTRSAKCQMPIHPLVLCCFSFDVYSYHNDVKRNIYTKTKKIMNDIAVSCVKLDFMISLEIDIKRKNSKNLYLNWTCGKKELRNSHTQPNKSFRFFFFCLLHQPKSRWTSLGKMSKKWMTTTTLTYKDDDDKISENNAKNDFAQTFSIVQNSKSWNIRVSMCICVHVRFL